VNALRPCSRCGKIFRAIHHNRAVCPKCKRGRTHHTLGRQSFGIRQCDWCGRDYEAHADHQRFCRSSCEEAGTRERRRRLYATPRHRILRKNLELAVASGTVRCAAGVSCRHAEWVDGELVGGLIASGEEWDLGHADEESAGGPEHSLCNRGRPMRRRSRERSRR
jgi:hypothetical protein